MESQDTDSLVNDLASRLARMQHVSTYVGLLRQKIGLYLGWTPETYANQVAEDNAYDMLKNDEVVASHLFLHSSHASQGKVVIKGPDTRLCTILNELVSKTQDLGHTKLSLLSNGMLFGLGVQLKRYAKGSIPFIKGLEWTYIKSTQEVDTRRLRIERDSENRSNLYWTIWKPDVDLYVRLWDRSENPDALHGEGIQDYMWYIHEKEELNPYYRGLGVILYRLVYIRSKIIQYWADLCESWAKPFFTLSLNLAKGAISSIAMGDIKSADARIKEWLSVLESARSRHAIVKDINDKMEILEHGSTGNNILREFLIYVDEKIQNIFLGASLTTGTGKGVGSYALGEVHQEQTHQLVAYSRERLREVLLRELVEDLVFQNSNTLQMLGIAPNTENLEVVLQREVI